jgi:signal transduction histidine kinase
LLFSPAINWGVCGGLYMRLNKLYVGFSLVLLLMANCKLAFAQTETTILIKKLKEAQTEKSYLSDSSNVKLLARLSILYVYDEADSALYFAKEAMKLADFQKNDMSHALAWSCLGKAYYVLGDYNASLNSATKLMNVSVKINYQAGIASSYLIMGLIYMAQNNYPGSISDLNKALKIFQLLKSTDQVGKVYFNLGVCYDESGQTMMAFYYLNKAVAIAEKVQDNTLTSMALNRTGEIYFHIKNYNKALGYYTNVISSKYTNNWERDFAWSGIAQCYYALGNYNEAIISAQKSYRISRQVNSAADGVRALEILAESYAAKKDFKNAYSWQILLKKSNDSLFNIKRDKELNYLQLKQQQADNKRLENDIKNKEQSIAFSKRLLLFRNMIAVATAIFVIFIIINNRQKTGLNKILKQQNNDIALQKEEISRQKDVLDKLNYTKDQLFAVISHDLRGPFAAILQSLDAIRAGDISLEEQAGLIDDFYRQVNLVTTMVNNLLVWANSQQAGIKSIPVVLDITHVVNEIVSVSDFLAKNKNITINHQHDGTKEVLADADHAKIIIQNLIGNAIKFTRAGGAINIRYAEDGGYIAIHIKDTGVGISPEKMKKLFKVTGKEISGYGTSNEAGAGIGLALIKQFTDVNNGRLDVKSKLGEGSEFTVYLPKA